ncbi:hypothetical protein F0562_018727 [Nyssa sinensis]|uniref:Uncharacterized protein n=1 Tax=Nyssa sinensis TaxID=561372 RepID=A0A5J4ZD45_9ASTE|nr:hypothetical protein F0562_018727 [Nyssa sinensis]
MAEIILFDTASKFLGDLGSIALKEIALAWNVKKDIKKLEAKLSTIKAVLLDAEQQQAKNNEVEVWLGKLKHAFYGVDDLIDDFATEALRRKLKKKNENSAIEEVRDFFRPPRNPIAYSFKMSHKIKAVRDELDEIDSERSKFHFKERLEERPMEIRGREETHSFVRPSMTMKLSNCFELRELPIDIRKLIGLRHFEIDGCDALTHMPFGLGELTSLRTLPLLIVGKHIPVSNSVARISELNGLNNLRGMLSIKGLENVKLGTSKEQRKPNLKAKQYLRDLELEWKPENEDADADTTVLEDLQPHSNLKTLYIIGFGGFRFPNWMMVNMVSSVPNLVEITLNNCRKCQHLPWFGQLRSLKSLDLVDLISLEYIHNNSVESSSSDPSSSLRGNVVNVGKEWPFFPSLKELYLRNLPLLKEWSREIVIANDDMKIVPAPQKVSLLSFPRLTNLSIVNCSSLETVPLLPSLEVLIMSGEDAEGKEAPNGLRLLTSQRYALFLKVNGWLSGLTSLQSLDVSDCESLTSISLSRDLTALQQLKISSCSARNWSDKDDDMKVLRSLQSLCISRLPRVPHWLQHLTTLQDLTISSCDDFVTLPEWIGNLASLRSLHILYCQNLESLPDTMRCLTALKELYIIYCGILSQRCKRERGTEWPKIAHIPNILITPERGHLIYEVKGI